MKLISNHLLSLPEFKNISDDVVVRINMAHVKDEKELEKFVKILSDLKIDSKLKSLIDIITKIFLKNPNEKVIIFTDSVENTNRISVRANWILGPYKIQY